MRIGIDVGALVGPRAGIGKFLQGLLEALSRSDRGHEFLLYAQRPFECPVDGPRWRHVVGRGGRFARGALWLQTHGKWLAEQDHVDVFWGPSFLLPVALSRMIPALVTVHDLVFLLYPETMHARNLLTSKVLVRPSLWRAQRIMANSETTAADLTQRLGVSPGKIHVITPGVAPHFTPAGVDAARIRVRAEFGLQNNYLFTVGTLEPRKNLITLIRAFSSLPESFRARWPLIIAGGAGWKFSGIWKAAAPFISDGTIRFLGHVSEPDLAALYKAAPLFLFPSRYEGFGMPVVEAMASGVPTTVSDIPVMREVAGDAAMFVPPMDAKRWAEAIVQLIDDPSQRGRMAAWGVKRASRYSFDTSAQRLLNVLESLADGWDHAGSAHAPASHRSR